MIVDFCFAVGTTLVAVGAGDAAATARPFAVVDGAGAVVAGNARAIAHRRPDGASDGFLMLFSLAAPLPAGAVTLVAGDAAVEAAYTGDDLEAFAAFAGEEAFLALLLALARGEVPPLAGPAAAPVFARARARLAPSSLATDAFAAAIERVQFDPAVAAGLVTGRLAPEGTPAALLALTPQRVGPVETAFGALETSEPAAAGIARGRRPAAEPPSGFVGTFAGPRAGAGAGVLLLVEAEGRTEVLARAVEIAPFAAVAARFGALAPRLAARARVRAGLTGSLAAPPSVAAAAVPSGPPLLVLEHDGRPRALREVLADIAAAGIAELVLAGVPHDEEVENAVEGARRDRPDAPRLTTLSAAACLIAARSSMIVQFDVLPFLAAAGGAPGRLAVWDPSPRPLPTAPAAVVAEVAKRPLPFAVALAGPAAAAALAAAPLLTVAGKLLWALAALPEGTLAVRALSGPYFLGDTGTRPDRAATPAAVATLLAAEGFSPLEFDLATIAAHAASDGDARLRNGAVGGDARLRDGAGGGDGRPRDAGGRGAP